MTTNQLGYMRLQEEVRANKANEGLKERSIINDETRTAIQREAQDLAELEYGLAASRDEREELYTLVRSLETALKNKDYDTAMAIKLRLQDLGWDVGIGENLADLWSDLKDDPKGMVTDALGSLIGKVFNFEGIKEGLGNLFSPSSFIWSLKQ